MKKHHGVRGVSFLQLGMCGELSPHPYKHQNLSLHPDKLIRASMDLYQMAPLVCTQEAGFRKRASLRLIKLVRASMDLH